MILILRALLPETILVVGALAVLSAGLARSAARTGPTVSALAFALLAGAAVVLVPVNASSFGGMIVIGPLARLFKLVILALGGATIVFAHDNFPPRHYAESLALVLFSVTGMMLLVATEDLLMIFVALELTSIPLYILAAFNKDSRASAEAGLKYFLIGSVSAAFLLYGLSLIHGVTGSTGLRAIALTTSWDPLLAAGIVLALGGFAFKVAAVPFQLWAPDVYEGAPTPAAALIASGSKVAGVFILARILNVALEPWAGSAGAACFSPGWAPVLAIMAAASMVLGNLAALVQTNVKRLLAYSAIAHGGYMLLGLSAPGAETIDAVLFYVVVYALTTAGAFGVVAVVEKQRGGSSLADFDGLSQSSPGLALCLLVFLVSLAGIPPLAGFFAKFYLFASVLQNAPLLWIVILAIALNAVSLYYYLIVLKHAFVFTAPNAPRPTRAISSRIIIALLALAVIVLGLAPGLLLGPLTSDTGGIENIQPPLQSVPQFHR